ncbi:proteasome inhibitor PI31 subunit-like [Dreissena polymorpha]|uniref:Proteasome inhibitor PI31 subunit n=1 Tax=Dreissena polymorpha TaxID=45954 RepID=A0A9D4DHI7_DREPO|nr:proteasome inhibitor PI31 subunit-like [Dreissena polymorpha]KAH3748936.1 hypothetical protein DPMN_183425 [Dreissena polymorpha]
MASAGMELMFNSVKPKIKCPQDAIVCVLHWQIISAGYTCLGIGEDPIASATEEDSEMLPDGWNSAPDLYVLQYKSSNGQAYMLKIIVVDGIMLVHFWRVADDKHVATMNIRIADYATEDYSSYKKALKQVSTLCKDFKREILDTMKPASPKPSPSSKGRNPSRSRDEDDDPLRVPGTGSHRPRPTPEWQDPDDPFSVGRGDLDPFGRGGGGMFFDPLRGGRGPRFGIDPSSGLPSRLPPGAVPPGARFDPFGPPGTHPGRRPGPDPDHMRPPDWEDDMFM